MTRTRNRIVNHYGRVTVQTADGVEVIRQPLALTVIGGQARATAPIRAARDEIGTDIRRLTSSAGQTGGRRETPTDFGASRTIGITQSVVSPTWSRDNARQPRSGADSLWPATADARRADPVGHDSAQISQQQTAVTTTTTVTPPATAIPRRFYAMTTTTNAVPGTFASAAHWNTAGVLGYGAGGVISAPARQLLTSGVTASTTTSVPNTRSSLMAAGLMISGQGAGQTWPSI